MPIPDHMRESLDLWVRKGQPHPRLLGSFLRSVLANDFAGAVLCADGVNAAHLVEWARHLHNEVPALAHGSEARLECWHSIGGLDGYRRARGS